MADEPRARGLPAVEQSREARTKMRWPSPKFWAYTGLALTVVGIIYWRRSQAQIDSDRQALMAKQRAVKVELGPRWDPMRDKIESWTIGLANDAGAEHVERDILKTWDFREKPGVYLRLRLEDAKSPESIRKNAKDSLRDAFTSCLMRIPNANPLAGRECKRSRDCDQGEFCNELDRCSRPAQPFNLRVAYKSLNLLSDEWVRDVQEANTELRLRLLSTSYEDAIRDDIPLAVEFLTRAQYFLLVLDEAPSGQPAPKASVNVSAAEALQAVAHPARVAVWNLEDGKNLLRLRREAGGQLLGAPPDVGPEVLEARQRQANSCALALDVRTAMGDPNVPGAAAADPSAGSDSPSPGPAASASASAEPSSSASAGPSSSASAGPAASVKVAPPAPPKKP